MTPITQNADSRTTILRDIKQSLGRQNGGLPEARPSISPENARQDIDGDCDRLVAEINALSGNARRINPQEIPQALRDLIDQEKIEQAVLWDTPELKDRNIPQLLKSMGVNLSPANIDKTDMARIDLGVTEVDYAIAETGTLCLLSSEIKPRTVSLLPRVHLAIMSKIVLRAGLQEVFKEAREQPYMIFITGPSRTADIELIVTLGVHGPKKLYVWVIE